MQLYSELYFIFKVYDMWFLTKMRCDFYFCTMLPTLSEFREFRMVSDLAYLLQELETLGVHIFELFMTFHLLLRLSMFSHWS